MVHHFWDFFFESQVSEEILTFFSKVGPVRDFFDILGHKNGTYEQKIQKQKL